MSEASPAPPAPPIPEGTYVNYDSITGIGVLFPVLAIILMGVRAYGYFRHFNRKLEVDDCLIIPAGLLDIAAGVAMVIGAQLRIVGGHSYPMITPKEHNMLGKFEYAFWIGHVLAIGFIKLTLLFLFRSLFRGRSGRTWFDYGNWTLIVLTTAWLVVFLFFEIFACGTTPQVSWESFDSLRTKCVDTFGMQTGCAVFSWVLDLAIFVEPLFMIRTLNMSLKRKVQASVVFLFSGFAVIAGLLRMIPWIQIYVQDVRNPTIRVLATDFSVLDQQGVISVVLFWTYMEIGVGFLVACVPRSAWVFDKLQTSLSPILSKLRSLPSSVSSFTGRGGKSSSTWSRSQRSANHTGDDTDRGFEAKPPVTGYMYSQRSLTSTIHSQNNSRKPSINHLRPEDQIQLVTVTSVKSERVPR